MGAPGRSTEFRAPWHHRRAAVSANRKCAPSTSSIRVLARSFKPGMALAQLRRLGRIELRAAMLGAAGQIGQGGDQCSSSSIVGHGAQIMAVHVLELGEVEARRRAPDLVEDRRPRSSPGSRRIPGRPGSSRAAPDNCAGPPADSPARDRHRRRARRAASTFGAVRPVDQRDMGQDGGVQPSAW